MQINCNALHHYDGKLCPACNTNHEGVELVTQDKNQVKKTGEPSSEAPQDEIDFEEIPRPSEEIGGPNGLEPTRYGDWERKGRCIDF